MRGGGRLAGITENTKLAGNPARKQATAAVREAEKALAATERGLAALLVFPTVERCLPGRSAAPRGPVFIVDEPWPFRGSLPPNSACTFRRH